MALKEQLSCASGESATESGKSCGKPFFCVGIEVGQLKILLDFFWFLFSCHIPFNNFFVVDVDMFYLINAKFVLCQIRFKQTINYLAVSQIDCMRIVIVTRLRLSFILILSGGKFPKVVSTIDSRADISFISD